VLTYPEEMINFQLMLNYFRKRRKERLCIFPEGIEKYLVTEWDCVLSILVTETRGSDVHEEDLERYSMSNRLRPQRLLCELIPSVDMDWLLNMGQRLPHGSH
jgi:hypothetical protein